MSWISICGAVTGFPSTAGRVVPPPPFPGM
jgi:hypothetical protein